MSLDKKESQLYGKAKISGRKRSGIKKVQSSGVRRDWGGQTATYEPKKKRSIVKSIFAFSLAFFAFAVIFLLFQFVTGNGKVSTKNIDIEVLGNTFTAGGEELPLQIQVTNRNSVQLEYSDLLIEYPDGAGESVRDRVSLGTIKPGETVVETRDIVLFGMQGSLQEVKATIEYRIKGSNAIFFKEFSHFVTLNSAPIDLLVEASENVVSGQRTSFAVTVRANNSIVNEDIGIKVDYPIGFRYEESDIEPVYGDNIWHLGDLGEGVEKEINITGVLFGESGEERAFRFFVGPYTNFSNSNLAEVYSSYVHTAALSRPFIGTQVLIGGIDDEVVARKAGETIPIQIKWSNNLPTRIDDVVLEVQLEGDILNEASVQNFDGFYNSNSNILRWDKTTYGNFASVQPGVRGTLNFSLASLPLYQSGSLAQDAEITLSVSISGEKPTEGGALESIQNSVEKTIQINSDLFIAADGFFENSPFNNQGSIPPVVGQETEYTIIWSVTNSANVIGDAKVTTVLPNHVVYKNQVSPANESVVFNPNTRELTWNIGAIARGAGLTSSGEEVAFLLGFTPSLSQVGSGPLLTGQVEISGRDLFTGETLRSTDSPVSIRITNDTNYTTADGRVVAE